MEGPKPTRKHRALAGLNLSPDNPQGELVGSHVALVVMPQLNGLANRRARVTTVASRNPLTPVLSSLVGVFEDTGSGLRNGVAEALGDDVGADAGIAMEVVLEGAL